jgi:hypothetical protein
MIVTPLTPRGRCAPVSRSAAAPSSPADAAAANTLAAQHSAFDAVTAEHAELARESAALQDLMLAQLKNEDEVMKKWIAMI